MVLVPGGVRVCQQGEAWHASYVVASGRLVVVHEHAGGREDVIGQKGRGDSLGGDLGSPGSPRSATVRAVRDPVLARLSCERAETLLRKYPDDLSPHPHAGRLAETESPVVPALGCVAVAVTAARPDVPLGIRRPARREPLGARPTLHLTPGDGCRVRGGAAQSPDGSPSTSAWRRG